MSDVATGRRWWWRNWRGRGRIGSRGVRRAVRDDGYRWGYPGDEWTVRRYSCSSTSEASCVDPTVGGGVLVRTMVKAHIGTRALLPEGDPVRGMDVITYFAHDFDLVGCAGVDGTVPTEAYPRWWWTGRSRRGRCRRGSLTGCRWCVAGLTTGRIWIGRGSGRWCGWWVLVGVRAIGCVPGGGPLRCIHFTIDEDASKVAMGHFRKGIYIGGLP